MSARSAERLFRAMSGLSISALFGTVIFAYDDNWSRMPRWFAVALLVTPLSD